MFTAMMKGVRGGDEWRKQGVNTETPVKRGVAWRDFADKDPARGRKPIGHTSSGKPVLHPGHGYYDEIHHAYTRNVPVHPQEDKVLMGALARAPHLQGWSKQDHNDAARVIYDHFWNRSTYDGSHGQRGHQIAAAHQAAGSEPLPTPHPNEDQKWKHEWSGRRGEGPGAKPSMPNASVQKAVALTIACEGIAKAVSTFLGEGTRGGQIIGHTRNGRPVYASHSHSAYSGLKPGHSQEHAKSIAEAHSSFYSKDPGDFSLWRHGDHGDAAYYHDKEARLADNEDDARGSAGARDFHKHMKDVLQKKERDDFNRGLAEEAAWGRR